AMRSRRQASHSDRILTKALPISAYHGMFCIMDAAPANRFGRSTSRTNVVISTISPPIVPPDRRQSPTALAVSRGTQRLLVTLGLSCVAELPLLSGRRADLVALGGDGEIWIVEIKSSVEDFRADQKWGDYRMHCDRLFFATAEHVPLDIF